MSDYNKQREKIDCLYKYTNVYTKVCMATLPARPKLPYKDHVLKKNTILNVTIIGVDTLVIIIKIKLKTLNP